MRISGIETSSVILSQSKKLKRLKNNGPKVPKEAEAKRDGVINPQNYNFYQFEHSKASVTILAGFSPEFDPPFLWRSKHQTKNDCVY